MRMEHLGTYLKIDEPTIKKSLRSILSSTEKCTKDDLEVLHMNGLIPTGVKDWILASRVKVG